MQHWLLTWNPKSFLWPELSDVVARLNAGSHLEVAEADRSTGADRWSCSGVVNLEVGDRLVLLKQGTPPRGIIGVAKATSKTFLADRWDGTDRSTRYVNLEWEQLLDPLSKAPLAIEQLSQHAQDSYYWHPQRSGQKLPADIGEEIERALRRHIEPRIDWTADETLLAFDFYLEHRHDGIPGKSSSAIRTLSQRIQALPIHPVGNRGPKFRNTNGVYMKLMNLRSHDPEFDGAALERTSHLDAEIWEQFAGCLEDVSAAVDGVEEDAAGFDRWSGAAEVDKEPESSPPKEAKEGKWREYRHQRRERKSMRASKLKRALQDQGELRCEACDFKFHLPAYREAALEVHHRLPIADGVRVTRLDDLAVLCATCHRLIHAKMRVEQQHVTVPDLRAWLA